MPMTVSDAASIQTVLRYLLGEDFAPTAGEVDQLLTSLAGVVRGARDTATGDDP